MSTDEIDTIASSDIDTHLAYAVANRSGVTQISQTRRVEAGEDSCFGTRIPQVDEPSGEDVGLLDLVQGSIVSERIRVVKTAQRSRPLPNKTKLTGKPPQMLAEDAARTGASG